MIKVKNLTKKFDNFSAVNSISFEVMDGEIFAFLGPNGAGKSTTIKMLTTLLSPTTGKATINGYNPTTQSDEARRSFGVVFQDSSLDDDLTAVENMKLHGVLYDVPCNILEQRTEQLLKLFGLWDRKDNYVREFSGGMKRRLEVARSFLHHPQILFLDEPTLGLDPQTRHSVWASIKEMNQTEHITVFFTTHYMEEADRMAKRIAIIDNGKIIANGTPEELKKKTNSLTLEDTFLALTGKSIREESAGTNQQLIKSGHSFRIH